MGMREELGDEGRWWQKPVWPKAHKTVMDPEVSHQESGKYKQSTAIHRPFIIKKKPNLPNSQKPHAIVSVLFINIYQMFQSSPLSPLCQIRGPLL